MSDEKVADPSRLYDALAPVYDRWQSADGWTPFADLVIEKLEPELERFGGEPRASFIDFGCGTGALLCQLRRRHPGWRLAGLDASAAMLAEARGKHGADSIDWIQARLEEPRPLVPGTAPAPFDAAGCFYDTLNHLPDAAALGQALRSIAASLRPGGLFVFDVTNEDGFLGWWTGRRTWHGAGWRVAIAMAYDPSRRESKADVTIDHGPETTAGALVERCFARDEWRAALDGAGLDLVAESPWNPFPDDAPGKTWVISRKRTS